ncbi:rhoptry kinase family protein [Cystoisospora suis]|uniref:Rhoptry kinase family protein n=1 Tax=Cystoisospora suis TaxID=483139 RepID=A0A2C6KHE4_9APIC|nr:rhoptry kinase family protein [Cystoisospora suis]
MSFWSWVEFLRDLPSLNESKVPVLRRLLNSPALHKDGSATVQLLVPSKELLNRLSLTPQQEKDGLMVKVRVINPFYPRYSVYEIFVHTRLLSDKKLPLVLPSLGEFKGGFLTYIFYPRTKGRVGDLLDAGKARENVRMLAAQMLAALKSLHKAGLLHQALQLNSFHVRLDGHVVLGGVETVAPMGDRTELWLGLGSYDTAPEVDDTLLARLSMKRQRYTVKTDVYSLGVALQNVLQICSSGDDESLSREQLQLLQNVIKSMTAEAPAERPNIDAILAGTVFQGIQMQELEEGRGPPPIRFK